jgi:C4-dicarboxylate-specific signal transduction histidine kinase
MNTEETLRQFIGAVVACFTHEIQNNLATIHEVAGLMDDMIERGKAIDPAQLTKLAAMTNRHVSSALGLIRCLNSYAHRLDEGVSSFCVNDALEELLALTGRICRQKQVDVRNVPSGGRTTIRGNPILLQALVFRIVETILEATPEDVEAATVAIRTRPSRRTALIEITPGESLRNSPWAAGLPDDQKIQPLLRTLGITMTMSPDKQTVILQIPSCESAEGEAQ